LLAEYDVLAAATMTSPQFKEWCGDIQEALEERPLLESLPYAER
jgi:hypothetical protein